MQRSKIKILIFLIVIQLYCHELAISHPHGSPKSEQVNYYVTNPPSEYSISLNHIGSFNATQGKIFTCLKPYQNGVLAPIGGVSEFSIAFSIISGAEGTIGVAESGTFNPSGNLGSDGEKLS